MLHCASLRDLQPAVLSCQMPSILSSSPAPTVAYNLSCRVLYEVQTNVNATSLHGRDLEGLVGVATGLLASRDISRCRRADQAGPRPTDLSAARDFFPSGQYPGYRIPSHTASSLLPPSLSAHGSRGPTSPAMKSMLLSQAAMSGLQSKAAIRLAVWGLCIKASQISHMPACNCFRCLLHVPKFL